MRACSRVALVLMALSASFGLAACAAIDDLKFVIAQWFESASSARSLRNSRRFASKFDIAVPTPVPLAARLCPRLEAESLVQS